MTLTKRMAEDLTDYFREEGLRVAYLHSDIATVERLEILRKLRQGLMCLSVSIFFVSLDLQVSLIAILDADRKFLRSERSLIRLSAARHAISAAVSFLCR